MRAVCNDDTTVTCSGNLTLNNQDGRVCSYKYNQKELEMALNLNWYNFGWRPYDPTILRTPTPDPHAENFYAWSPYSMFGNNPVNNIDPTGMDWYSYQEKYEDENGEQQTRTQYKYVRGTMSEEDMKAGGYAHVGETVSIANENGGYTNYYQNIGFKSNQKFDAKKFILNNGLVGKYAYNKNSPLEQSARVDLAQASIHRGQGLFMRGSAEFTSYSLSALGDGATALGTAMMAVPGLQVAGGILISGGSTVSRAGTIVDMGLNAVDEDWGQFVINGAALGLSKGIGQGLKNSSMTINQKNFLDGFLGIQIFTTNRIINWGIKKK